MKEVRLMDLVPYIQQEDFGLQYLLVQGEKNSNWKLVHGRLNEKERYNESTISRLLRRSVGLEYTGRNIQIDQELVHMIEENEEKQLKSVSFGVPVASQDVELRKNLYKSYEWCSSSRALELLRVAETEFFLNSITRLDGILLEKIPTKYRG